MKIINTVRTITMKTSPAISTIQSYPELKELISKNKISRVYLFIGNGPKKQYFSPKASLPTYIVSMSISS